MKEMVALLLVISFSFAAWPNFVKPEAVKVGQWGYGLTTFEGYSPQRFEIKILGIEQWWLGLTSSPVIMAKCYGGPKGYNMAYVGVASGMSGSPIYIYTKNGPKLIGALAYGSWFDRDPICGITPVQKMLEEGEKELIRSTKILVDRSTLLPIVLSGPFNCPEILKEEFAKRGLSINFLPRAVSGKGTQIHKSKSVKLEPGSPIFAALTIGDIVLGAHGTVTMVNEETGEFYGFGHPFLNTGLTSIPVSLSRVETTVSNYFSSYKMFETGGEIIGSLTRDFTYGVKGKLGPKPEMVPVSYKLAYKNNIRPINVEVAKIPNDWTNYLILVLSFYTIYGGYQDFNLARIDRYGYAITKVTIKGDFPEIVLACIINYDLDNAYRTFFYYNWDIYDVLQKLADHNLTIKSLSFEVEYKTGKPDYLELERALLDKNYAIAGDSVKISLNFQLKDNQSSSVSYKTIYALKIPAEADTGTVTIQIKSGDNLIWSTKDELSKEEILQEVNSLTNLFFFIKANFPLVNNDTTPFVISDSLNIKVEDRNWQRKEEKQKPIKEITVFEKITPPENVMVKANETLFLKIVSKAEYERRKAEEQRVKKEEGKTKKKKKFWRI
jgi:hypothetical protein